MRRKKVYFEVYKARAGLLKRCTDPVKEETFLGNGAVQIENALLLKVVMSSSLGLLKYILHIHWVDRSNRWQVRLNVSVP